MLLRSTDQTGARYYQRLTGSGFVNEDRIGVYDEPPSGYCGRAVENGLALLVPISGFSPDQCCDVGIVTAIADIGEKLCVSGVAIACSTLPATGQYCFDAGSYYEQKPLTAGYASRDGIGQTECSELDGSEYCSDNLVVSCETVKDDGKFCSAGKTKLCSTLEGMEYCDGTTYLEKVIAFAYLFATPVFTYNSF